MNHRKIQLAEYINAAHIKINGEEIPVAYCITYKTNHRDFKFARRAFAGADRIKFTSIGFERNFFGIDGTFICKEEAQRLLNVGKNTKTFSVWFKNI